MALISIQRSRILLAEDDPAFRRLLATALTADGHEVVAVASGNELLGVIGDAGSGRARWAFDLVISDVRMPGRSGLEVLRGLRRSASSPPFVLITAFGDEELHEEAQRLGAAAVVDKPFEIDDLRRTIDTLLAGR